MTYLLILVGLIGCMVLLDFRFRLLLWSRPVAGALTLVIGTAFFLIWDIQAIQHGIFLHRASPLMTGIMLGDQLPLEELFFLFFLCYQSMILFTGAERLIARRRAES
ncbi:lycopene cyclase domain-containing protein [Zhihengliuella halotolerans]|uniref:Lycopene cyclase domain-containing protein n=1 Tax=Zhihengliuella halotolerans TaxID=370736 RepID=A0A4Q8AFB6_9MICC|nr:lycopene cyclase domain-containing protein [Zhihengliuella halotolerans]RZU62997.1 lycopene cyclase domain-containing protein [Zhihengliuella halotolerans]